MKYTVNVDKYQSSRVVFGFLYSWKSLENVERKKKKEKNLSWESILNRQSNSAIYV